MAVTKIKPVKSTLSKALDYIENPDKTDGKMLISSFGCSYETADIEFGYTLSQALDKGNNLAFHLIQSFAPGEVDYEKAHEIGKQLADAVTKGQHEYVVTTHIDKGHIHNHIIFCAVNFVDHHKYNSNKRSYYGIRNMSDKLCRENGLSVVVPGKGSKGKSYAEYQAEKTGTSWKGKLKLLYVALGQLAAFELPHKLAAFLRRSRIKHVAHFRPPVLLCHISLSRCSPNLRGVTAFATTAPLPLRKAPCCVGGGCSLRCSPCFVPPGKLP